MYHWYFFLSSHFLKILRNAFEDEDIDQDGFLNRVEFSRYSCSMIDKIDIIRAISSLGARISSREVDRLFDYMDSQDVNDGALKIAFAISFFNRNSHSSQQRDDLPSSKRNIEDSPRRRRDSEELPTNDAASIVFRKQPHLLEELIKMTLSIQKRGRLHTHH